MSDVLQEQEAAARKHPEAHCEVCPLRQVGRYVPSAGPSEAKIAFVGEAPGRDEARGGVPFTGPSGRLLNNVMSHHGIEREAVFLTNACSCRPPDNATPPKSAIQACRPRLLVELRSAGVETVVALGNSACQSLLGVEGVTKLRVGPGRESSQLPDVRIIPTIHPAACLRQGDSFPFLIRDVGKVVIQNDFWAPPEFAVFDNVLDALRVIDALRVRPATQDLVVDIEVDVEKDIAFEHPNRYHLLSVGIGYDTNKVVVLGEDALRDERVLRTLGDLFRGKRIIAHNGKFDLSGLYPHCGPIELFFDTMLASYTFDERPGIHGLKTLAVEYLGAPQYDDEIKKYVGPGIGYGAIPRDLLYRYNAYDVACTYALYQMFVERYRTREDLRRVHDFLVAASNELMYVELNGITIDKAYLDELTVKYLDVLEVIEGEVELHLAVATNKVIERINPRSPKQVKEALAEMKIHVQSTNQETLELVREKLSPESARFAFVDTLLRHRREQKLYGTYVKGIRKRMYRGRVYPTFLLHGTTTGRLACRNPNLQNVPRESSIRDLFVPSKLGTVFVQADYGQAELRVLTFLAQEEYFRNIFNDEERDLFDEFRPILYGNTNGLDEAHLKELRIRIKAYAYGVCYGREALSIAQEFKIPMREAKRGMDAFFEVIPNVVAFYDNLRKQVLSGKDLVTPFGRHRRFWLITDNNKEKTIKEARSFPSQSTASDICLGAAVKLRREDFKGKGVYIRNLVHDSILTECKVEDIDWVKETMEKRMLESAAGVVGDYVKFKVDMKVGRSWGSV